MTRNSLQLRILGPVLLGFLHACSSGDVSVSVDGPYIGPVLPVQTSEAITSYGAIAGLGGLMVNDVRYATGGATVTLNGQPGTLSDLNRGQIVAVTGEIDSNNLTGTARSIRYDANVIGPLESLDVENSRLLVMGQTVTTGPDTVFATAIDPATYAGLTVGDTVEVSGFAAADGHINATRIELEDTSNHMQIVGTVADHDLANLLFTINRLTVDYSNAAMIDLPGGAPTNAMTIKAIGTITDGILVVDRLLTAEDLFSVAGRRVQTAGVITRFNSLSDFDLNGRAIATSAATVFVHGNSGNLTLNAELVIDGAFAADGRITAHRISFGHVANVTTTLAFDFSDFSEIYVPTVFNVAVTRGPEFSVQVIVDAHAADRVAVTKTGARLDIALQAGDGNIETLRAFVTMPVLDRIDLTGVVNATVSDFSQAQMIVNVGGVSRLQGNGLTIGKLIASVTGVSHLAFGNIRPLGDANIEVNGVSRATLNMDIGAILSGSVGTGQGTGTSMLFYYGTNVSLNVASDFLSAVIRLGSTRP